jgi:BRCA1/BRCA2-containing complex subunit 3
VEVGYEQLAQASEIASRIERESGVGTRVIGWYHSHPHITVLPSHVDVRTQAQVI